MLRHPSLFPVSLFACALAVACSGGPEDEGTTSSSSSSAASSSSSSGSSSSGSSAANASQGSSSSRGGSSAASQGGGSSSGGNASSQEEGSSSQMMGNASSAQPGPCDGNLFGYPVILVCDYGNAAAGSRVVVSVLGSHLVEERTAGQPTTQTEGSSDASLIGAALYLAGSEPLVNDLGVASPNEGRAGTIIGCEGDNERLLRWEGTDPDSGYWLVRRNPHPKAEELRQLCNALTSVDTPQ
jgi:hypothetical protein